MWKRCIWAQYLFKYGRTTRSGVIEGEESVDGAEEEGEEELKEEDTEDDETEGNEEAEKEDTINVETWHYPQPGDFFIFARNKK